MRATASALSPLPVLRLAACNGFLRCPYNVPDDLRAWPIWNAANCQSIMICDCDEPSCPENGQLRVVICDRIKPRDVGPQWPSNPPRAMADVVAIPQPPTVPFLGNILDVDSEASRAARTRPVARTDARTSCPSARSACSRSSTAISSSLHGAVRACAHRVSR